jgi:hypothetical protein
MGPGEACVAELYGSRGRDLFNAAYGDRFNRVRRSFRIGDRKLILGSDGSIEAYDLALDPGEERDLRAEPWARQMAREAQAWLAARGVDDAPEGGGEEPAWADVEALRALGYVE